MEAKIITTLTIFAVFVLLTALGIIYMTNRHITGARANIKVASYSFNFPTTYNQFYLYDKGSGHKTGDGFWDKAAYEAHLAIAKGIIGIGTESYGEIKSKLFLLKQRPDSINTNYDHIVEAGIDIESGCL